MCAVNCEYYSNRKSNLASAITSRKPILSDSIYAVMEAHFPRKALAMQEASLLVACTKLPYAFPEVYRIWELDHLSIILSASDYLF